MSYVVAVWRNHLLHRELFERLDKASRKGQFATKREAQDVARKMKHDAVPGTMFTWPEIAVFKDGAVVEHWRLGRGLKYHQVVEG